MKMKIALLVLHIFCAIAFGVCAVLNTNMVAEAMYTLASIVWSICVGMDIIQLIYDN